MEQASYAGNVEVLKKLKPQAGRDDLEKLLHSAAIRVPGLIDGAEGIAESLSFSNARLTLNPKNPRLHTEKQIRQIARSVETFWFQHPDCNRLELHGHCRSRPSSGSEISLPTISLST
jgi:hypothetical protein